MKEYKIWNPFYWVHASYAWVLRMSEHKHSVKALFGLSLVESFIFPIPTDLLLIPMGAARPKRALYYAFIASIASVMGAFVGYALGAWAWSLVSDFFFSYVFSAETFSKIGLLFEENAIFTVFIAAFTPIPFKACTVAAGVFSISLLPFLIAAIAGRTLRFFLVSGLIYFFGAKVRHYIEKYFEVATVGVTILAVLGVMAIKWLH